MASRYDSAYWLKRLLADRAMADRAAEETLKDLKKLYRQQYLQVSRELDSLYAEYQRRGELSRTKLWNYAAARRIEESMRDFSGTGVVIEAEKLYKCLDRVFEDTIGVPRDALESVAGMVPRFVPIDKARVIGTAWSGASYSERVWRNREALRERVKIDIEKILTQGKGLQDVRKQLMREFDVSFRQADRLLRTELAYVQNQATLDRYRNIGVKKVTWQAKSVGCTCERCQALDGKTWYLPDAPIAPLHPNCRCGYLMAEDDAETDGYAAENELYQDDRAVPSRVESTPQTPALTPGQLSEAVQVSHQRPAFAPASSIEEAEAYGRQYIHAAKSPSKYYGNLSYKGLDLDSANALNKVLMETFDDYDAKPLANIAPIPFREKAFKDATMEAAYKWDSGMGGTLYFNQRYFKSAKVLKEHMGQADELLKLVVDHADELMEKRPKDREYLGALKQSGRQVVAQSYPDRYAEATFNHELGHMLDDTVFKLSTMHKEIVKAGRDRYAPGLSGYAVTDMREYVAESYCAYRMGEEALVDPALVVLFKEAIKWAK